MSWPTSSTPRARRAGPRAWRWSTPASATSSGWPPPSTASQSTDRVYQGMTIAFDFSVEEIWVPWMAGATLVPKPGRPSLLGTELRRSCWKSGSPPCAACRRCWRRSTRTCPGCASCWSPARPARRTWSRAGTVPAGASSTSTAPPRPPSRRPGRVLRPGRPVSPRRAPAHLRGRHSGSSGAGALPRGAVGEIGIAGVGLARGYVNRARI